MRKLFTTTSLTLALLVGGLGFTSSVNASTYQWVTCYETVVCYEVRSVAYTKYVTKYDHCGKAYSVAVTCYQDVQVPVKKTIAVKKLVKVCD